jgi:hypothetical protein
MNSDKKHNVNGMALQSKRGYCVPLNEKAEHSWKKMLAFLNQSQLLIIIYVSIRWRINNKFHAFSQVNIILSNKK